MNFKGNIQGSVGKSRNRTDQDEKKKKELAALAKCKFQIILWCLGPPSKFCKINVKKNIK